MTTFSKHGKPMGRPKKVRRKMTKNPAQKLEVLRQEAASPETDPDENEEVETEPENVPEVGPVITDPTSTTTSTPLEAVASLVDAETAAFERYQQQRIPAAAVEGTAAIVQGAQMSEKLGPIDSSAMSILDLADQISTSPAVRSAATTLAEQTLSRMLFDATEDNRVIVTLNGQSIQTYKSDWLTYNSPRLDKIPFSTYLARRLNTCRAHSADKSLYLRPEHIQLLDKLAGDNFMSADQLVAWITRALTPVADVEGGEKVQLDPIPNQVWERFAGRCYYGETPVQLMNKVVQEALAREVGLY